MSKTFFSNRKNVLHGLLIIIGGLVVAWALIELFRVSERQGADFEEDVFFGQSNDPVYKIIEDQSSSSVLKDTSKKP